MDVATVNGIDLEYEVTGSGEPVLLVSPVLADGFAPLVARPELADHYQLIRYHKRGWGGSSHPTGPVAVEQHADDAAALLDHLGVRRAHVAGHSSGAAVALQLALDDLDRVHTLVLLELSLLTGPKAEAFLAQAGPVIAAHAAGDHETAVISFLAAVSGMDPERCRRLLEARVPDSVAQAVKDADTLFGVELPGLARWTFGSEAAARIHRPVLSVVGSRTGPLWVDVAAFLRQALPYAEEAEIAGVGHLLHLERPAPVAAAVAGFLGRNAMS